MKKKNFFFLTLLNIGVSIRFQSRCISHCRCFIFSFPTFAKKINARLHKSERFYKGREEKNQEQKKKQMRLCLHRKYVFFFFFYFIFLLSTFYPRRGLIDNERGISSEHKGLFLTLRLCYFLYAYAHSLSGISEHFHSIPTACLYHPLGTIINS